MKKLLKVYLPEILKLRLGIFLGSLIAAYLIYRTATFSDSGLNGFGFFLMMFVVVDFVINVFSVFALSSNFSINMSWAKMLPIKRRQTHVAYASQVVVFCLLNVFVWLVASSLLLMYGTSFDAKQVSSTYSGTFSLLPELSTLLIFTPFAMMFFIIMMSPFGRGVVSDFQKGALRTYNVKLLLRNIVLFFGFIGVIFLFDNILLKVILGFSVLLLVFSRAQSLTFAYDKKRSRVLRSVYFSTFLIPTLTIIAYTWSNINLISNSDLNDVLDMSGSMFLTKVSEQRFRELLISEASSYKFKALRLQFESHYNRKLNDNDFVSMLHSRESYSKLSSFLEGWDQSQLSSDAFKNLVLRADFVLGPNYKDTFLKDNAFHLRDHTDIEYLLRAEAPGLNRLGLKWSRYIHNEKTKQLIIENADRYQKSIDDSYQKTAAVLRLQGDRKLATAKLDTKCELVAKKIDISKTNLDICVRQWTLQLGLIEKNYDKVEAASWDKPERLTKDQLSYIKELEVLLNKS